MGTAPPKPPGLIGRRRLLALARAAYAKDDMPAFIDTLSKGFSPLLFTVQRPRLVNDSRLFTFRSDKSRESYIKLFDAALFDNKRAWGRLAVVLGIPPDSDDTIPALFKPLLLDRPEFIELLVGSDPAAVLRPLPGTCFARHDPERIDLLGAAARLGATHCAQLLFEKVLAFTHDPQWEHQAQVSLKLAAGFARLHYLHHGTDAAQKLCTDLSAATSHSQPIASSVPASASTSTHSPEFAQLILDQLESMSLRFGKLEARIEALTDENQALRDASRSRGFDPLRLIGRRRESAPLNSPAAPGHS